MTLDEQLDAYDNRLENERATSESEYEHYLEWCEVENLDPDSNEAESYFEQYLINAAADWAAEKAEQRAMDDYYFGGDYYYE